MGAKVLKWEMREMCTVSKRVLILSQAKCLYIEDLVLNKDPFWHFGVLIRSLLVLGAVHVVYLKPA